MTLFPEMFPGPLGLSLAGEALRSGIWSLQTADIRTHGLGRHSRVDDTPAGGGPGMVPAGSTSWRPRSTPRSYPTIRAPAS